MPRKLRVFFLSFMALALPSCSGLLYYPSGQLFVDPARFQLKPEEVFFSSANGSKLFGWYFPSRVTKKPKATVVFFHGNAENLSSHYLNLLWLIDYPFDFFIFDYQGYGRSEGEPSPERTVQDGRAALAYAHSRDPKRPLVVFGQSLGGNVAMRTAIETKAELPIKMVAVDSTFASYRSVGRRVLSRSWITWPFQWIGWLALSDAHAPDGRIGELSPLPLLVIHGKQDRVVEFELGEDVFAQGKDPKEFWPIPSGGHTDVFTIQDPAYKKRFVDWMTRNLEGSKR